MRDTVETAEKSKQRKMSDFKAEAKTQSTKTENKDGVKTTTTTTKTQKTTSPNSAKNAFKQLDEKDAALNPPGSPVTVQRSAGSIKQMLLEWCQIQVKGYENVNVTNFSSSWNDGMAFCALIHRFYPRAFNYAKLNPKCRRGNFKLAFDVAEKLGGVAQLLDVDDMVKMKNPDWKCVFTYIQQFYSKFRNWDEEQVEKAMKEAEANMMTKEQHLAAKAEADANAKIEAALANVKL